MSTTAVRSPAEFEEQLQRYLYERSEEGRAVRVGEKEVSEQAAIVVRYADLFSREQLQVLRDDEEAAEGDQREWLYRLRKTCESGLIAAELAEKDDELENAILAARLTFKGEELPLRSALARLAVISDYKERDELGELHGQKSAEFNEQRLELLRAYEELEADLTEEPDAVARNEEEKQISLRELESVLAAASAQIEGVVIAGKTGTAQTGVFKNGIELNHAWFTGYAPANDPKIVIAVMLELVPYHGTVAARIASKMIEHYLKRPTIQGALLEGD